ncbi:sensor histidine kinase [Cellulosilyticum sp. I15G10I2]|uniref:sensor histidine kinase n=1 Tax=Cellulosilyticum sp. I15G10I2 TaxID=1892843 RepID=UPI0009F53E2A|nr:sensor histidine kinase [Cellulosilyticum sp. I15G10I2]
MNLNKKFLLIFLLLSIIPIIIITTFTYDRYTNLVNKQMNEVASNIFESALRESVDTINEINRISEIFQFYSETTYSIVDDLKKYKVNDGSYTTYDLYKSRNNMMFVAKNLIYSNDYINGLFIFTPSGENIGYGYGNGIDIKLGYKPFEDDWYQSTLSLEGKIHISDITKKDFIINSKPSISFSRAIYDVYSKEFLGVLLIDCSPNVFNLSSINTLPDSALLSIQKNSGSVLYSNINDIKAPFTQKNTQILKHPLGIGELVLVAAINHEKLYHEFDITKILIIVIAALCCLLFIVISIILSHYLIKPITKLSKTMAGHHEYRLICDPKYLSRNDEIGILYNEYNNMLEEINRHVKEQYQNKLITLDSQMKSLEAQINSHFLYNTLESINSIAEIEEVESISIMSLALGNMFRYSIKTQSELVTIRDEISHVNDYMSIQKIRFEDRFNVIFDTPEHIGSLQVLKLILQPIVENALYHGLERCQTSGTIVVRAYTLDEHIYFEVADDGVGMDEAQLKAIRAKLAEPAHFTELGHRNKQSIGLKNIHSRIALYYGKGYGLSVHSEENKGAKISIKLPILKREG